VRKYIRASKVKRRYFVPSSLNLEGVSHLKHVIGTHALGRPWVGGIIQIVMFIRCIHTQVVFLILCDGLCRSRDQILNSAPIQSLKLTGRAGAAIGRFIFRRCFWGSILFPSAPSGSLALRWHEGEMM